MSYFLRGLLISLIFGVPAGAVGALTIQRALKYGFWSGFITGLGSSAADVIYAGVGIFGLTFISDFLIDNQKILQVLGGLLIVVIGLKISMRDSVQIKADKAGNHPALYFLSSFSIAVLNPATIVSFLLAFAAFGLSDIPNVSDGVFLLTGIFAGTVFWWALISGVVTKFRDRVTGRIYHLLNVILGCAMVTFGVVLSIQGLIL